MKPPDNPLFAKYEAKCTFTDCPGKLVLKEAQSAGLRAGEMIPVHSANPSYGRYPICKRHMMKITKTPPPPQPDPPKGFTKIPRE